MATLLAGYEHGGATVGEVKIDEPLKIKSTPQKSSVFNRNLFNRIRIGDIEAIGRSSNVYMFKIAIAIANSTYRYEESLYIREVRLTKRLKKCVHHIVRSVLE